MLMKKFTIAVFALFLFAGVAKSQMIEDFEHIPLNVMTAGEADPSNMIVVPDPDPDEDEDNDRGYVVRFERSQNGIPWGGFYSLLPEPLDFTTRKYVHVDVWKPRVSPVRMKIEGGTTADIEVEPVTPQALTEEWETLTFHFNQATGTYATLVFMPDFNDPLDLDEDIVIYFDNFRHSDNAEPGEGDEVVIEDFNFIPMNLMLAGETDESNISIVPNPDPDDVNPSEYVARFERSSAGIPWGGFWSELPEPLDLTENKFVYVKVWKPRISPVRFKVEGGQTANLEIESMSPQTRVEQWEELVFDFSEKDGTWNVIAFMPDFADPVNLDEDIVIYFDDIRVAGAPAVNVPGLTLNRDVLIFPNPARTFVNIRSASAIQSAELVDLTGRVVKRFEGTGSGDVQMNISGLNQGIYIVRVMSENNVITQKLKISQ
jgi:hypothetical protein